jgi:hypothetical protein
MATKNMTKKKFELAVLVSLLNGNTIVNATEQQVEGLVEHIVGKEAFKSDYAGSYDVAIEHVEKNHPKVVEAAQCVIRCSPDIGRYNKLIDLYRNNHEVDSLVPVKEKAPEEKEEATTE